MIKLQRKINGVMDLISFKNSVAANEYPSSSSVYLQALWLDAKERWNEAHQLIQDLEDVHAAWIHAYLHRREGDNFNADYWYTRAGKNRPAFSLDKEWEQLVTAFL